MNPKTNSRKWSWIQLNERRAARTGLLLLLLLAVPAVVQAQFTFTTNNGTITITQYTGPGGAVIIPSTTNGLAVTSIGNNAFGYTFGYTFKVTSVTIPDSVTYIGFAAFEGCGMTNVTIGTNVSYVDDFAFHLSFLTTVTIPTSVTYIGRSAFVNCIRLTAIAVDALNPDYSSLDGVLFDKNQTTLMQYPAGKAGSQYTIPRSVSSIGSGAFFWCSSLTSVTIGNCVTNIDFNAFYSCTSLTGAYFEGNAPSPTNDSSVFSGDDYATIFYLPGSTGWGTTYDSRPTALWPTPTIQTPPQSQTAEVGSVVALRVTASGPSLFCLWYLNSTNLISCSTNCRLELTNVQIAQSGTYTAVITNAAGAITSAPAMLNVIAAVERRPVPGLKVTGKPGSLLNVDYANSLSGPPNWTTLGSVSLTGASHYYFDLTLPLPPQRFYRLTGTPGAMSSLDLHTVPAITVTGKMGDSWRVDYINQFGPIDAWVTLDTVTLTNSSQLYFDVSAPGAPQRLYRLVQVP